jgi:subtilase family serine protease
VSTRPMRRAMSIACSAALSVGFFLVSNEMDGASASGLSTTSHSQSTHGQSQVDQWQLAAAARATPSGCAVSAPGKAHCYLSVLKAERGPLVGETCKANESAGYSACNIQSAYKLTKLSATNGAGETVAVVDAYDDPNAEPDLAVYRSTNNLPACTTENGCFKKVNQDGVQGNPPAADVDWGGEISLDLDMVSAVCPNCHIILVEANSGGLGDLLSSVAEAVSLGANVVSDSWGTGEFAGETGWDGDLDFPGVPITFSSGDGAYQGGVQYPSASPYVISVGGTMLTPSALTSRTQAARKWTETAWVTKPAQGDLPIQGSGSGCSAWEPKPAWQTDSGCSMRMTADLSAVAADVLSYDTFQSGGGGWYYTFGTSVSSPIIASIYALAGNSLSVTSPASIPYANASVFHDITSGSEGKCTPKYFCKAGVGYDGPTGLGSPDGDGGF